MVFLCDYQRRPSRLENHMPLRDAFELHGLSVVEKCYCADIITTEPDTIPGCQ